MGFFSTFFKESDLIRSKIQNKCITAIHPNNLKLHELVMRTTRVTDF